MKQNSAGLVPLHLQAHHAKNNTILQVFKTWLNGKEPLWEENRLGISATGVFIQVTFAGAMILILGAAGAPPLAYGLGIFFAFLADSLAFAQAPMRWVLGTFLASIVVNLALTVFYLLQWIGQ
jgi:hypothetical protein